MCIFIATAAARCIFGAVHFFSVDKTFDVFHRRYSCRIDITLKSIFQSPKMSKNNYQSLSIEQNESKDHGHAEKNWGTKKNLNLTTYFLLAFQFLLLVLFGTVGGSELVTYGTGTKAYNMLIGVEIMM